MSIFDPGFWNPTNLADAEVLRNLFWPLLVGILAAARRGWRQLNIWRATRNLEGIEGLKHLSNAEIKEAVRYYVWPDCSEEDPTGTDNLTKLPREKAHAQLMHFLTEDPVSKHLLVLADSGMGKSALLINYLAWNSLRLRFFQRRIVIFPLSDQRTLELVSQVENKINTILFLDAFDEDAEAQIAHEAKLKRIVEATKDFYKIVITCRTHFFGSEEEIPVDTGIRRTGVVAAGQGKTYDFRHLYLMPFTKLQIARIIFRRISPWKWTKAWGCVAKSNDLAARPMLLAHLPLFLDVKEPLDGYHVYKHLVDGWIEREDADFPKQLLLRFSTEVALKMNAARSVTISRDEALAIAKSISEGIEGWKPQTHSLLNRNQKGEWKFAHRSIGEFLTAKFVIDCAGQSKTPVINVSDVFRSFYTDVFPIRTIPKETIESLLSVFNSQEPPFAYDDHLLNDMILSAVKKMLALVETPVMLRANVCLYSRESDGVVRDLPADFKPTRLMSTRHLRESVQIHVSYIDSQAHLDPNSPPSFGEIIKFMVRESESVFPWLIAVAAFSACLRRDFPTDSFEQTSDLMASAVADFTTFLGAARY